MKLKTLLTTLSFFFVFSQPIFAVESEVTVKAQNILKFKAVNKCPYCDLSGADFSGLVLSAATLYNANLTNANFSGAQLHLADFRNANLTNANLTNAYLKFSVLTKANFTNANLLGADLTNALLGGAIFCNTKTPWGLDNSGCE